MSTWSRRVRHTGPDRSAAVVRLLLGLLFVSTGLMKMFVPRLGQAFASQVVEAGLPFPAMTIWLVPIVEIGIGLFLLLGLLTRPIAALASAMMLVATWVHLTVDHPDLFPLQPQQPIVPLVTLVLCLILVWRGAGAWSLDRRSNATR